MAPTIPLKAMFWCPISWSKKISTAFFGIPLVTLIFEEMIFTEVVENVYASCKFRISITKAVTKYCKDHNTSYWVVQHLISSSATTDWDMALLVKILIRSKIDFFFGRGLEITKVAPFKKIRGGRLLWFLALPLEFFHRVLLELFMSFS